MQSGHARFLASPAAPRQARVWLSTLIGTSVSGDSLATALLLTSELVTNAVSSTPEPCLLAVQWDHSCLRVEVRDGEAPRAGWRTTRFGYARTALDSLTESWGIEPVPGDGKVVWYELVRP